MAFLLAREGFHASKFIMDEVIYIQELYKQYESNGNLVTPVLKNINLSIHSGEFVAIMGPSGSGKSTFMNILGCLDTPTSGKYLLKGQNVQTLDKDELAHIRNTKLGFVFQNFNLLPRRDIVNNAALPLLYAGIPKSKRLEMARQVLKKVGLESRLDAFSNELSGGQQQRVAIARAIVNNPEVILADEPTGNLDTATSIEIMNIFTELNTTSHITIVLVTHEFDIAKYAKRLVRFKDGQITYDGPVATEN